MGAPRGTKPKRRGSGAAAAAELEGVVEAVERDALGALGPAERLAAVQRDAPELLALIGEMRAALAEVRGRVGPLLQEVSGRWAGGGGNGRVPAPGNSRASCGVAPPPLTDTAPRPACPPAQWQVRDGDLATSEGVSYLEAKHLLLLNYCTCLVFYLLLKVRLVAVHGRAAAPGRSVAARLARPPAAARLPPRPPDPHPHCLLAPQAEGRPVQNHPVIGRLVEIRSYLVSVVVWCCGWVLLCHMRLGVPASPSMP